MASREDEEEPTRDTDGGWSPPQRHQSRDVFTAQVESDNPPTEGAHRLYEAPAEIVIPERDVSDVTRAVRAPRAQRIQSRRRRVESWLDNVLEQSELEIHHDDAVLEVCNIERRFSSDSTSDLHRRSPINTSIVNRPFLEPPLGFTPLARPRVRVSAASGSQETSTNADRVQTIMPPRRILRTSSRTNVRKSASDGEARHVKKKRSCTQLRTPTPSVASRPTATSSRASTTRRGSTATSSRVSTRRAPTETSSRVSTRRAPTETSSRVSTRRVPTETSSRASTSTISRVKETAMAGSSSPGNDIQVVLHPTRHRMRPTASETVTSATSMDIPFEEPVKLEAKKPNQSAHSSITSMPSTSTLLPASQTASEDLHGGPRKLLINQYCTPSSSCTSAVPSTSRLRPEPALARETRTFVKEISRVISIRNPRTNEVQEYWVRRNAQLLSEVGGSLQDTTHIVGTPSTVVIRKKPEGEKRKKNLKNIKRIPSKTVGSSSSSGSPKRTPSPYNPAKPTPLQGPRFRRNRNKQRRRKRYRRVNNNTDTSGYPTWEDVNSHPSSSSVSELYPVGSESSVDISLPEISLEEKVETYLSNVKDRIEDDDDD